MSDLWLNIRFGARHLQIGPRCISFRINGFWMLHEPDRWIEVYEFLWWSKP
jgi:hypothetical protein